MSVLVLSVSGAGNWRLSGGPSVNLGMRYHVIAGLVPEDADEGKGNRCVDTPKVSCAADSVKKCRHNARLDGRTNARRLPWKGAVLNRDREQRLARVKVRRADAPGCARPQNAGLCACSRRRPDRNLSAASVPRSIRIESIARKGRGRGRR